MRAPFPYFGNKALIAQKVWKYLGNPDLYIEPFAGALGVYLNRPPETNPKHIRTEVIGDFSALVSNLWRGICYYPARTACYACNIVSMADYHAAHKYLCGVDKGELAEKLRADSRYCDCEVAGNYIWLLSSAIGGHPEIENNPRGQACDNELMKSPQPANSGVGVNSFNERSCLKQIGINNIYMNSVVFQGSAGQGINRWLPPACGTKKPNPADYQPPFEMMNRAFLSSETGGVLSPKYWRVLYRLMEISERMSNTDIMVGDFETETLRFLTHTQISRRPHAAVFLDPPYIIGGHNLYGNTGKTNNTQLFSRVLEWCKSHEKIFYFKATGEKPKHNKDSYSIRVVLSCYDGDADALLSYGWRKTEGKTINGMSHLAKDENKKKGKGNEVLYISPQCPNLDLSLFP